MSTDYNDKRPMKSNGLLKSFQFASQGIKHAFIHERNMKIHGMVSIVVILLGFVLGLTLTEWLFVLFAIAGVISLELINTAIERVVDLTTSHYHPLAKQAKDVSAGAVFIYSCLSVIIGIIIFLPKIIQKFELL